MTPSGWRDDAERTRASEEDMSDGPELNYCESEKACRHTWVSVGIRQSKACQTVSMDERGREAAGRGFQVLRGAVV
jgi:hypothetical protein